MGFGGSNSDPQCGGQFILAGPPKAQLIMHCLQHELWQSASIMHSVRSANNRKRVDESFFGSVLRYCPRGYLSSVGRLVRLSYELHMALENLKHISLIFGYLLENHVRKSEDFYFNLDGFWLLRINLKSI